MGINYLLDTHTLLWLLMSPNDIEASALDELAEKKNTLWVSAVSAMEVATKHRLGRLDVARSLIEGWSDRTSEIDAKEMPLSSSAALLAGSLTWDHRDPFDRMLVAQALTENVVVATRDRALLAYAGLPTLSV